MKRSAAALLLLLLMTAPAWGREYQTTHSRTLARGVRYLQIETQHVKNVINAARVSPQANVDIRAVVSNGQISSTTEGLELTSAACHRLGWVCVNADYFDIQTGEPIGGVVRNGIMLRSPQPGHYQLIVKPNGKMEAGNLRWSGGLRTTDGSVLKLDGLNVARAYNQLVLYTPAYGSSTGTVGGKELILEVMSPLGQPKLGQGTVVKAVGFSGSGNMLLAPNQLVLSVQGRRAKQLSRWWDEHQTESALLMINTFPHASQSVGGAPILLRHGLPVYDPSDNSRHPRTLVGWNQLGVTWLVTVDGRQPGYSLGMTLAEATDLMLRLGATDAINLDGGGSTTFASGGKVLNRPSDGHERPVANFVAIVPQAAQELADQHDIEVIEIQPGKNKSRQPPITTASAISIRQQPPVIFQQAQKLIWQLLVAILLALVIQWALTLDEPLRL